MNGLQNRSDNPSRMKGLQNPRKNTGEGVPETPPMFAPFALTTLRLRQALSFNPRKRYSFCVNRSHHLRGFFSVLVGCVWITTACFAEHVSAEFPLCQPAQSPCCPQPANNTSESCPACHITTTVAAKDTREQERLNSIPQAQNALRRRPCPPVTASRRESTPGLRYQPAVFDLKDDLRI